MRIITLRFNVALGGGDDKYFFIRNELPYLTTVVVYEPVIEALKSNEEGQQNRREEPWRRLLKDTDMQLFDSLRSWRAERSKQDGIPPYVICNNKQLVNIVAARSQTLSGLLQIESFGKAKAEKYGLEILPLLKNDNEQSASKNEPE